MAGEGDAERLVVLLEARIRDFEKNMAKASGTATRDFNKMRQQSRSATQQMEADMLRSTSRINQALAATSTRMGGYGRSMAASFLGVFAGAAVVRGTTALVDANTRVTNSLKVAGLEGEALTAVYDKLMVSAQKNAVPIEDMATLYGRATMAAKNLGASQQDLLKFADGVAVSLRVSGKSAQEAGGALLQLSQLLGGSVVQAEEYNSLIDGAYPLLQAVAAGMKEAGGDVAKLTQLVKAGKVPTKAFFDAFQAGSSILEEKVAGAELTTSQALVRLQNVLQDAAGKFNSATGASSSFARTIDTVATSVEGLSNSKILAWLGRLNNMLESSGFLQLDSSLKEIKAILGFVDDLVGKFDEAGASAAEVEAQLMNMMAAIVGVSDAKLLSPEMAADFADLIAKAEAGTLEAAELQAALVAAGAQDVNFLHAITGIAKLTDKLREARAEAIALASIPAADGVALQRDEQTLLRGSKTPVKPAVKAVSLDDYDKPTKPGKGAKSAREKEAEELERQKKAVKDLIDRLEFEKSLIGLSAVQQARLTALREAGAAATEEQRLQIGRLVEETAREQAAIDYLTGMYEMLGQAGEAAFMGIIDAMKDGKIEASELGEILSDVLGMASQFFLNAAFKGMGAGLGLPGFASGTANTGGQRGQPRGIVHGQEAVIPLPDGGKVPVQIAAPLGDAGQTFAPTYHITNEITLTGTATEEDGAAYARGFSKELDRHFPAAMAKYERNPLRRAG